MSFFILGLPRSRTAWLANFMTYGGYHCYHEGTNGCYTIKDYKAKLNDKVGDSNTGAYMLDFRDIFPTDKVVIIDSSIGAAVEYGLRVYKQDVTKELVVMKGLLDRLDGLHVNFDAINNRLEEIWMYLTDGASFDAKRAELLKTLNVYTKEPYNVDLEAARSLFNENAL